MGKLEVHPDGQSTAEQSEFSLGVDPDSQIQLPTEQTYLNHCKCSVLFTPKAEFIIFLPLKLAPLPMFPVSATSQHFFL